MSRRSALPGAAELFRTTGEELEPTPAPEGPAQLLLAQPEPGTSAPRQAEPSAPNPSAARAPGHRTAGREGVRGPTGRERHDEKITVYVSGAELLDLERARLTLRADHGLAVDRGRIVREALAVVLADLEAAGDASVLVRRLRSR